MMAKWQEGDAWAKHLEVYDTFADEIYGDARIVDVESRFGTTRAYVCGDPAKQPVFLMHGAHDSSLTWEWLLPELVKHHQVVALDRIGDFGRSLPRNGLTSSLPDGEDETVEWIASVKSELGFAGTPVSFVCHSYGCFVTTMFTMAYPAEVDKLILTAPAAVVAPQQIPDLIYPAVFHLVAWGRRLMPTDRLQEAFNDRFNGVMLPDGMSLEDMRLIDFHRSLSHLPHTVQLIAGNPHPWPVYALKGMASLHSVLLLIGDKETATHHEVAVANARSAGIITKVYPGGTHLISLGNEEEMTAHILAFLAGEEVAGAS
jgi:pimeloyl-ACP methyl ester carboxylesterase